jgi:hypothetical protein
MHWTLPRFARLGADGPAADGVAHRAGRSPSRADRMRSYAVLATITVLAAVTVLASGCSSGSPAPPVSLPVPKTGEITFYLSLPASTAGLEQAAEKASQPGSPAYREFISLDASASRFGATDTQINAIAKSVRSLPAIRRRPNPVVRARDRVGQAVAGGARRSAERTAGHGVESFHHPHPPGQDARRAAALGRRSAAKQRASA